MLLHSLAHFPSTQLYLPYHMSNGSELLILSELRHCLPQLLDVYSINVVRVQTQKLHQIQMLFRTLLQLLLTEHLKEVICIYEIYFLLLRLRLHHLLIDRSFEEFIK